MISSTSTFTLSAINPCLTATISYTAVASQTYTVGNTNLIITLADFTSSVSDTLCGTFAYTTV